MRWQQRIETVWQWFVVVGLMLELLIIAAMLVNHRNQSLMRRVVSIECSAPGARSPETPSTEQYLHQNTAMAP